MLHEKLFIPINLALNNNDHDLNYPNNDLIQQIKNSNKFGMSSTIISFKKYFNKNISEVITKKLFYFIDEIIPILFQSKQKEEGLYQLLRFIDKIISNFSYIEALKENNFVFQNLAKVFLFSGYVTNIIAQDKKILDVLQPEYALRLNGNISFYKNIFDKIDKVNLNEEDILDRLRRNHRFLKFQILFAFINNEIDIERTSNEFSLLAQATFNACLTIAETQMSNKHNVDCHEYSVIAYGRFATFSMTSNSDLDLVFIYEDLPKNQKLKKGIYIELFRQLIKLLSAKTSEGFMYEVDTKLRPSGKTGPVACTYNNFKEFHEKKSFAWEKLALNKTRVLTESKLSVRVYDLLKHLNSKPISTIKVADEVNRMRIYKKPKTDIDNEQAFENTLSPKWFETKYVVGGQREIEYLNFFYKIDSIFKDKYEVDQKILFNDKIEKLFFKLDQIVNICFEDEKQDFLPSNAILKIIKETNEKDLGSLKATVNLGKKEVHKNLNQILVSIKKGSN